MGRTRRGRPNKQTFAEMDCPVPGCDAGYAGAPKRGSVPGMKRHAMAVHGAASFEAASWPGVHGQVRWKGKEPKPGSIAAMSLNQMRQEAKCRGISSLGKSKQELFSQLLFEGPDEG